MITISDAANSCGLKLLGGEIMYKTAETYFKDLARKHFTQDFTKAMDNSARWRKMPLADHAVFIYSHQPKKYTIGHLIKDYIEKHNLGTVTVSGIGINPVHQSPICVWVWTRDNEAFAKHCKELLCPIVVAPPIVEPTKSTVSDSSLLGITAPSSNNSGKTVNTSPVILGMAGCCPEPLPSPMPSPVVDVHPRKAKSSQGISANTTLDQL